MQIKLTDTARKVLEDHAEQEHKFSFRIVFHGYG